MSYIPRAGKWLAFGLAATGSAIGATAQAQTASSTAPEDRIIGTVIVTAQKKEESIQDVPIAVSALSESELTARGLTGGPNIVQAIPNLTFSKANFTGFNLQIRGIGTKLVTGTGDVGVGVHHNNVPLTANRFFEAEFYDIERIEVLRGPQGTLYGRNATGGVFNTITAKPKDKFEASATLEGGNYNTEKFKGMVNLPLGDMFALRVAGSTLSRDGFVHDVVHNTDIDGRDLWSGRATLLFRPNEAFNATLMWEHFEENDDRQRSGKQLCTQDPGPTSVGGQSTTRLIGGQTAQWYLTQGCLPGSIYSPAAFSTTNSSASSGGLFSNLLGIQSGNAWAGKTVSTDLRDAETTFLPKYKAKTDLAELNLEFNISKTLKLTSLTSWNQDYVYSTEDYNRAVPTVPFNSTPLSPGGFITDPQLGRLNSISAYDISYAQTKQVTEELRLQSSFDSPFNFNVGAIYLDYDAPVDGGYYVLFNTGTAFARANGYFVDPNPIPNGTGHNYYFSLQAYELKSAAGFGELYWQMTDKLKWTLGLRYTDDKKTVTNYPVQFLVPGGPGFTNGTIDNLDVTFKETTGRFGADYKLTDNTLLYVALSRGYKGGGFNPPLPAVFNIPITFKPEFVNALEIGAKNSFFDNGLILNATGFYYDYKGYQVSRIVDQTVINDNLDAKIYGAELEFAWHPIHSLTIDGNLGYLHTSIGDASAINTMNKTQGNPNLTLVKGFTGAANCVLPTATVAGLLQAINAPGSTVPVLALPSACANGSEGVPVSVKGKQLPNSPHLTANIGIQNTWGSSAGWNTTLRGDFYHQTNSFSRIFNTEYDRLRGWSNVNVSLTVDNAQKGWNVLVYVTNVLNKDNITDAYLTDDSSGLWTNAFLTDPRLYGMAITKRF